MIRFPMTVLAGVLGLIVDVFGFAVLKSGSGILCVPKLFQHTHCD